MTNITYIILGLLYCFLGILFSISRDIVGCFLGAIALLFGVAYIVVGWIEKNKEEVKK